METTTHHHLRRFADRFFESIGARIENIPAGMRVELTKEPLELLEGRTLWGFGMPWSDGLATLYLAFPDGASSGPDVVEADVPMETVAPGSFRLRQMCAAALRLGAVGRGFILGDRTDAAPLRPWIVFHFVITYVGRDIRERLASMAVDLVSGHALPSPSLTDEIISPTSDGADALSPRLSVGEAHERAVEAVCRDIADEDPTWFHEQRRWIDEELDRLYSYLQRASDEYKSEDDLASLREARLAELRELNRPRVEMRAAAATLLYAHSYWPNP